MFTAEPSYICGMVRSFFNEETRIGSLHDLGLCEEGVSQIHWKRAYLSPLKLPFYWTISIHLVGLYEAETMKWSDANKQF
jgi:hypothetical protein